MIDFKGKKPLWSDQMLSDDEGPLDVSTEDRGVVEPAECVTVGFYDLGMPSGEFRGEGAADTKAKFKSDVAKAIVQHQVDILCLCNAGDYEAGAREFKPWLTEALLDIECGNDTHISMHIHGSFATVVICKGELKVLHASLLRGLDSRPGQEWRSAQHLVLENNAKEFHVLNANNPCSLGLPLVAEDHRLLFEGLMASVGATPGGAPEPTVRWILGGNLNCSLVFLELLASLYQPAFDSKSESTAGARIEMVYPGEARALGDVALCQGLSAYEKECVHVGGSWGGCSAAHNLVLGIFSFAPSVVQAQQQKLKRRRSMPTDAVQKFGNASADLDETASRDLFQLLFRRQTHGGALHHDGLQYSSARSVTLLDRVRDIVETLTRYRVRVIDWYAALQSLPADYSGDRQHARYRLVWISAHAVSHNYIPTRTRA